MDGNNHLDRAVINTVLEIEKAIEKLPEPDQRKLATWFGDHRLIVEASGILGGLYDEEDGGENQLIEDEVRSPMGESRGGAIRLI